MFLKVVIYYYLYIQRFPLRLKALGVSSETAGKLNLVLVLCEKSLLVSSQANERV